jgi:hypothetical protein
MAPILMKVINSQWHVSKIFYIDFHSDRSKSIESIDKFLSLEIMCSSQTVSRTLTHPVHLICKELLS